ncbi:MAG TPA: YkvA family protein [Solirubrobacterales bacterium]
MSNLSRALIVFAVLYALFVFALLLAGRRSDARALAGFIPDCVVLFRGLLGDERVPRSRKLVLVLLIGYLVSPIDLIPDFIPVAGQFDDAIVVALGLRFVLRGGGPALLDRHWSGPPQGARPIKRLAFGSRAGAQPASRTPS